MAGGKRPGAGRKKGTLNAATLDRMKVNEEIRQRTLRVANLLFDSQLSLARGQQFLYRIDKQWVQTSKNGGYWRNKKPVLVEDPEQIEAYLDGEYDGRSEDEGSSSFYFITTKEPNGPTIQSMLDRGIGKVATSVELAGKDGGPIEITGVEISVRKP